MSVVMGGGAWIVGDSGDGGEPWTTLVTQMCQETTVEGAEYQSVVERPSCYALHNKRWPNILRVPLITWLRKTSKLLFSSDPFHDLLLLCKFSIQFWTWIKACWKARNDSCQLYSFSNQAGKQLACSLRPFMFLYTEQGPLSWIILKLAIIKCSTARVHP